MYWCPFFSLDVLSIPKETTIVDIAKEIKKNGMTGVAVPPELMENRAEALEASKALYDLGMKWNMLPTPVDFLQPYVTQDEFDEGLEKLKVWAELGQRMGIKHAYNHVIPSGDLEYDENFERHVRRLFKIGQVMQNNGIKYGLEYVGEVDARHAYKHTFAYTLPGIMALADAAGHGVGFVYDTYHTYCGGRLIEDYYLALQNIDRICGIHFSDGMPGKRIEEQKDLTRSFPETTGVVNSAEQVKRIEAGGYTGPILIEPYHPVFTPRLKTIPWQQAMAEYGIAFRYALDRESLTQYECDEYIKSIKDRFPGT